MNDNKRNNKYKKNKNRPLTSLGTGKIEALINTLSNIENNSNIKTLSEITYSTFDIFNDDGGDDDYDNDYNLINEDQSLTKKKTIRPLINSNNYNINSNINNNNNNNNNNNKDNKDNKVITNRPLTSHVQKDNKHSYNEQYNRPLTSHVHINNNININNSIISNENENELSSQKLINDILIAKENHCNELPKHLQQFKDDLIYVSNNTSLQLPVLAILDPTQKRKASYLPAPNEIEAMKLQEYEKKIKNIDTNKLYQNLSREVDTNNYYKKSNNKEFDDTIHHNNNHNNYNNKLQIIDPYSQRYYNSSYRYLKRQEDRKIKENDYLSKYLNANESTTSSTIDNSKEVNYVNVDSNKMKRSQTAKRTKIIPNPLLSPIRNISTAPARTPNHSTVSFLSSDGPKQIEDSSKVDKSFADLFFSNDNTDYKGNLVENNSKVEVSGDTIKNIGHKIITNFEKELTRFQSFIKDSNDKKKQNENYLLKIFASAYDDLGVNLDPVYNKKRYFGKSFMLLLYYFNLFRQRQGFIHFCEQVKKVTFYREENAGFLLVRVGRGMLGRLKVKMMRENLKRQAEAKAEYERQVQLYYDTKASIITKAFVIYVKTKVMKRRLNWRRKAVIIQKVARGYIIRRSLKFMIRLKLLKKISTIKIQCAYRQRLARRRVKLFTKIKSVMCNNAESANALESRRTFLRMHGGAYVIQRYYAAYKIRKRLKSMLFWHHERLITVTQARFRGFKVRKWYTRTKRLQKLKKMKQIVACTKIQSIFRGYCARKIHTILINDKKEVIKEKKRLKREKMKVNYFEFTFLDRKYKVNPFKLLRSAFRKSMPLRYMYEEPQVLVIQKCWRKFYAKKRVFRLRVGKNISDMMKRSQTKLKAAIMFQALYRGYRYRLDAMRKTRIQMCIRIQCAVRYKQANRRVYLIRAKTAASIMIRRNLIIVLEGRKLKKLREQKRLYDRKSRQIQRLIRRYLGRKYFSLLKSSIRGDHEYKSMARFHVDSLIIMNQFKVIRESLEREIGEKNDSVCGEDCIALGPVQAIFLSALGERAMYQEKALLTNKIDLHTLTKFANKLNEAFVLSTTKKNNSKKEKMIGKGKPLLLKLLDKGSYELPQLITKKLSTIDVSVAMSSAKVDSGSNLCYTEFVNWLYRIGDKYFKEVKRNRRMSLLGATVAQTSLRSPKNSATATETARVSNIVEDSSTPLYDFFQINNNPDYQKEEELYGYSLDSKNKIEGKTIFDTRKNMIVTFDDFRGDLGLCCVVKIFSLLSLLRDFESIPKVLSYLENESMARIGKYVIRIQQMYRLWKGRRTMEAMIALREQIRATVVFHKAGTTINSWIRRYVHKHRVGRIAQRVLVHYFPPNIPDYWYNPRTTRTHKTKPTVLLKYDCVPVPLPESGFECLVSCLFCNQKAQVNCDNCEESMCFSCFKNVHSKGAKINHHFTYIPTCCNCKFQNATKNCLTCIIQRPKPGDLVRDVPKADRGLYCDLCFTHIHDQLQQVNDTNHPTAKLRQYELLKNTRDAYLKQANLRRKILCEHRYDVLIEPCEECGVCSASWRCRDCNQLYCHTCLSQIHTSGVFKKHNAERLPYFTVEMASNYRHQEAIYRTQLKFNKLKKEADQKREQFRKESILKIQTWYRKLFRGRKGRLYMKILRTRAQRDYRYRLKETKKKRNTFTYKLLDFFSKAPILFSDTKEERVMKRVNILYRQKVKEVIWQNQSDWGFYKHLNPCKGVPKKGFAIGSIEELLDQANNGGYRMPGLITMKRTKAIHQTSTNLVDIIQPGHIIRVRNCLIKVLKVTEDGLEFYSRWSRPSSSDDDGEVFYRMPCNENENGKLYYKMKYYYQRYQESNLFTKTYWITYAKLLGTAEHFCHKLSEPDEKDGPRDKDQKAWLKKSKYYKRKREWAESYIEKDESDVSKSKKKPLEGFEDDDDDINQDEQNLEPYIKELLKIVRSEGRGGLSEIEAEKTIMELKKRKPGAEWFATAIEIQLENNRTALMKRDELAEEAQDWQTLYDPFQGINYYVNIKTKQRLKDEPKQITANKEKTAEKDRKYKEFEDTKLQMTKAKSLSEKSTKGLGGKKMLRK